MKKLWFSYCHWVTKYLGYFCKKICCPKRSKIRQSGHTVTTNNNNKDADEEVLKKCISFLLLFLLYLLPSRHSLATTEEQQQKKKWMCQKIVSGIVLTVQPDGRTLTRKTFFDSGKSIFIFPQFFSIDWRFTRLWGPLKWLLDEPGSQNFNFNQDKVLC